MKRDFLGKEYEEWSDYVDSISPFPLPEEERIREQRALNIRHVYMRLASLENMREERRVNGENTSDIDLEMDHLRSYLEHLMNDICPIVRSSNK